MKAAYSREIPIQAPPNVIARLMGIDAIPTTTPKPAATVQAHAHPTRQMQCNGDSPSSRHHCLKKMMRVPGRPRSRQRRRHPREDLLQKIRHDFQAAWQQASKAPASSCSATGTLDGRCVQMIAQENLRQQKMARYGLASSAAMEDEPEERVIPVLTAGPCAGAAASDGELLQPTPIVLLKPSSDVDAQEGQRHLFGLPKVKRDGNISRFLQEVKEMLQQQLRTTSTWGTTEPEQIAKKKNHVAHRITSATPRPRTETIAFAFGFGEQSFRSECLMKHKDDSTVSSARALFRSFSAPEVGFSFSPGSMRSATHDASGMASQGAAAMTSKNRANFSFIRATVSSLRRHSFSLRRNLSRRKTSLGLGELHPQMAIGTAPPSPETFNLFKVAQANLTELPPSPASPLEVAGHSCRHFFSDLNCTLPELSPKCLSEFEAPASELSYRTDVTVETACGQDKAYIREVLVAAGLCDDGSLDNKANARVDSMARPICDDIFEEVEDIYYYRGKYCEDAIAMDSDAGGTATDHRMLFDLANEALQSLVQGAKTGSSLRQWIVDSTGVSRGRGLVDDVWQQVQTLRNPQMQEMQTIDSMVAYEIRKSVWTDVFYEDVYVVGRKIERAIFDELIEDLMVEVFIL